MLDYLAELRGGVDRGCATRWRALRRRLDRPIHELSTGNRQKLGLIQAFMHEPELLILDEPIAGLDPLVQQRFHALLGEVAAQGRTVFLSSHTLSEVERVADRVAILRRGRLVVVDSLEACARWRCGGSRSSSRAPRPSRRAPGRPRRPRGHGRRAAIVVAFEGSADPIVKALAELRGPLDPQPRRRPRGDLPALLPRRTR